MADHNWAEFLATWSRELLEEPKIAEMMPPEVIESSWLGYPGASEEQISAAESRLGINLPSSYREFLKVTNGWRATGLFIHNLWAVEHIDWHANRHQDRIKAFSEAYLSAFSKAAALSPSVLVPDEEYFAYGQGQDSFAIRVQYLQTALEISDIGDDAVYLLNPQVVAANGEWEAWFFASWTGARRHRTFWEMMLAERERFLRR
jgi:hypothetical protein